MTIAFVLGNGISRRDIPILVLQSHGKIYGCNGLHRECTPEALIATDRPIATHIQQSGYAQNNRFYTRRPIPEFGAHQVPAEYYGYSSGPIAVSIAARDHHDRVYLLGFDLGPTADNQFNNMYAGTQFYKAAGANPTFTGNWIKQMVRVLSDHKKISFIRVCGPTTAPILELESIKNLQQLDLATFQSRINNEKDL
jgi:hypothetical protein